MKLSRQWCWLLIAAVLLPVNGGASERIPKRVEFVANTGSCTTNNILRFSGDKIFSSTSGFSCGGRYNPSDESQGYVYPLNGKETVTINCTWQKGTKVKTCSNGMRTKMSVAAYKTYTETHKTTATASFIGNVLKLKLEGTDTQSGQSIRSSSITTIKISGSSCAMDVSVRSGSQSTKRAITSCKVTY